jgi:AcrR family transcriptional regulator
MTPPRKKRVSKQEWLTKGLAILAAEGASAVSVERMARELGIAKSGFYWHFADRDALLREMLDHWAHEYTKVVTENAELASLTGEQRLRRTMHMILDHGLTQYDLSIRAWAAYEPRAARAMRKVYRLRLDFIRAAFADCGLKGEDLEMRARLFVGYQSWEATMFWSDSKKTLRSFIDRRLALLLRK